MEKANYFTDKCPCGSGLLIKDCCLSKRVNTIPKFPKTEYSNHICFARDLNDCSEKTTKEHFISNSVLKLFDTGKPLTLSETHWIPKGESTQITRSSLSSHNLCERHNSALSPLDNLAKDFFSFIFDDEPIDKVKLINGLEIERWMLKVLCGALSSGSIIPNSKSWKPDINWLNILFGNESISENQGLYIAKGSFTAPPKQIGVFFISDDQTLSGVSGIIFIVSGLSFIFKMNDIRPKIKSPEYGISFSHRPEGIQLIYKDMNYVREIHFGNPLGEFIPIEIFKKK